MKLYSDHLQVKKGVKINQIGFIILKNLKFLICLNEMLSILKSFFKPAVVYATLPSNSGEVKV